MISIPAPDFFGWMVIESDDDEYEVFGAHVLEIRFENEVDEKDIRGYTEIGNENLEDIKHGI